MKNIFIAGALVAASTNVFAQDKPDGKWHGNVAAGLSLTSGNSSSSSLSLIADGAVETSIDKISLYGLALRSSAKIAGTTTTTADRYRLGGRYERNLNERVYVFGTGEMEKDNVANLNLRLLVAGGAGYKVIRNATTTFDVFGGIAYTNNDFKAPLPDSSGVSLYIGEESTHKLSATSAFKQRLVITPGGGDLGTRASWDLGLTAAIAGNLSLNAGYNWRYASKVPAGVSKTDGLFVVGVGYKF